MIKKKIVVYGNCQSEAIARTLLECEEFAYIYEWVTTPFVHNIRTDEQKNQLHSAVKTADVFIFQHVSELGWNKEISTNYLITILKNDCDVISIPSLYFDGYFPHLSTMDGVVGPLNLVHDYFIASSYVLNLSVEQVIASMSSDDLYSQSQAEYYVESSIGNLFLRESEVDIKVAEYIKDNYKRVKLFNQFNHPTRNLIEYVCSRIIIKVSAIEPCFTRKNSGYLDGIRAPIYPSLKKGLSLSFTDIELYYGKNGGEYNLSQLVIAFYNLYDTLDNSYIECKILEKKKSIFDIACKRNNITR